MSELPIPPDAKQDSEAFELIRAWIIDGGLQVVVEAGTWEDEPAQWGRLLADTVGHLSDAISHETGQSREAVFDQIAQCLRYYLDNPRELEGEFVRPVGELDS